ncbi:MAG: hypothetical protein M4579_000844 [Chaenotheca gracillima]|nr:MAG: hypothetical protein M4579_000844 [Chaenotheca gracillima]
MRLAAYAGTSTVLATGVIVRAFHQRANFYSACVYLAQSNACLMILTNLVLLVVSLMMLGLQRLLYGPLRPIEVEQLYEKAWFAITETCLAMTIFRDEVGGWFLVMFVALLMGKVWEWIGEGRVEALEQQPPVNPRLFHARLSFSLLVSLVFDIALLNYSVGTVLEMARPNMMVMFAFEFAVLTIVSTSTAARYAISICETLVIKKQTQIKVEERRAELRAARQEASRQQGQVEGTSATDTTSTVPVDAGHIDEVDEADIDVPGWEQKGQWIFYLDLATDFFKLVVYLAFFAILLIFYGIPIHIIRDVFLTLRSFLKRIADFMRYRRATRDMNERYPDATAEEIAREETCIICREEMRPWQPNNDQTGTIDERSRPKKLPCNHILHFGCLRSWLERQQICPTCRRSVMDPAPSQTATRNPVNANDVVNRPAVWPGQQQPQAGAPPPGNGNAQPQNRGRVINLGPLRIGIGMGGPNVLQDLARQVHNGAQAQGQHPAVNPPAVPNPGTQFPGPNREIPVPSGQFNMPPNMQLNLSPQLSMQAQLLHLETQIYREMNSLQISAEQLRVIQMLQMELARLRQMQTVNSLPAQQGIGGNPTVNTFRPPQQVVSAHTPDPQRPELGVGHPNLPAGLTLPPGWTLLPLQRVDAANRQQAQAASRSRAGTPSTQAAQQSGDQPRPNAPPAPRASASPSSTDSSITPTPTISTQTAPLPHQEQSRSNFPIPVSGPSETLESSITARSSDTTNTETSHAENSTQNTTDTPSSTNASELASSSRPIPAVSIPVWGSQSEQPRLAAEPASDAAGDAVAPPTQDMTSSSAPIPAREASLTSSAAEPSDATTSEAKGKGKAVTVEDLDEQVD